MNDSAIRRKLVYKGLVRPATHQRAEPGKVIAVRRTDDRPVTQYVPVLIKQANRVSYARGMSIFARLNSDYVSDHMKP